VSLSSPDILTAALAWAAVGRPVFPLVPGEKSPAVRWSTEATTDPERLREWWHPEYPLDYGLGLPTGNGLIVVDVDVQKGGEIPSWAEATFTVATRSGGWHLYYQADQEVRNSVDLIAPGVDIRGDGGSVDQPVRELDALLLTAVQRRTGGYTRERFTFPETKLDPETGETIVLDPIGEGQRNDWLLRACGHARETGIDDEGTLLEWARGINQTYLDPPMDDREVERVVANSMRYLGL
jgi:hypothetical protein